MANWTGRARYHGERLARDGVALTPSLIGSLGYHEGADVTVVAMADFSRTLIAAHQATLAAQRQVSTCEGAEFLSDPCIVMGCIYHYGHDGAHEVDPEELERLRHV